MKINLPEEIEVSENRRRNYLGQKSEIVEIENDKSTICMTCNCHEATRKRNLNLRLNNCGLKNE